MGTLTVLLALLFSMPANTALAARSFPEHCLIHVAETGDGDLLRGPPRGDEDRLWNTSYREGFRAVQAGDYPSAEKAMCQALLVARHFDSRDWRFAETLDELGLIAYQFGEFERAEQMQGAAVAEMLLAVGPGGEPPKGEGVRADCSSGVRVYMERLGWVFEQLPGNRSVAKLQKEPWRVFAAAYLPLDQSLSRRLDWLISRYLLQENLTAAEALTELQREVTGE